MKLPVRPIRDVRGVPGDFYAEQDCCLRCGVPQHVAPDLVGWSESGVGDCVWKKQPATPQEFEQAIKVLQVQELTCHRYAGNDPAILGRLDRELCDELTPRDKTLHVRDESGPNAIRLTLLGGGESLLKKFLRMLFPEK
jgi:hypothetical protein